MFFFSRPFHENFNFLKNCPYDFHETLHSHSTPKGAPACAMASKSYGWHVRNIAKISPKMAKKQSFFDFFFDFLKNCPYDSNEIFYSHSTPYYGPLCAISLNSYGWHVENIAKISPKMAKKQSFFDFFSIFSKTVHTIRTKASQKEKDLSRLLYRICGSGFFKFKKITEHDLVVSCIQSIPVSSYRIIRIYA